MARSFKDLRDRMSPEARHRSELLAEDLGREFRLNELRVALGISREELGELLKWKQAAISRLSEEPICTYPPYVNS